MISHKETIQSRRSTFNEATDSESLLKKDKPALTKLRLLQLLMFVITFCNYAVLHATRSVWSAASKNLTVVYDGNITQDQIAGMNTAFLTCYGLGGFFTG